MNARVYRNVYKKTAMFMDFFNRNWDNICFAEPEDNEYMAAIEDRYRVAYLVLGLVGEAGELSNRVKKYLRGDFSYNEEFRQWAIKEVGDILWYVMGICDWLLIDMDEVMRLNAEKLLDRKERGVIQGNGDDR